MASVANESVLTVGPHRADNILDRHAARMFRRDLRRARVHFAPHKRRAGGVLGARLTVEPSYSAPYLAAEPDLGSSKSNHGHSSLLLSKTCQELNIAQRGREAVV